MARFPITMAPLWGFGRRASRNVLLAWITQKHRMVSDKNNRTLPSILSSMACFSRAALGPASRAQLRAYKIQALCRARERLGLFANANNLSRLILSALCSYQNNPPESGDFQLNCDLTKTSIALRHVFGRLRTALQACAQVLKRDLSIRVL
jgi:hypothetical protein